MLEWTLRQPNVEVSAVCDVSEERATHAQALVEKATGRLPIPYTRGPEDYNRMLERNDLDAVVIMTPQTQHARQAIDAMLAGKHVGSETPPAYTVEQCWELVETKLKTGRYYMLLENYPYSREHMMVLNMAYKGAFGTLTYGESSYIHDTRDLLFEKTGALSWRGEVAHANRGDNYPTHALAPLSLWMGINRGDRLVSMVSMDTGNESLRNYAREHFGKNHPAAQQGFFARRDTTITLAHTALDRLLVLRYDPGANRPAGGWEALQGTRGGYDGTPHGGLLYLQGKSPDHKWEPMEKYREEFEHPYWKENGAEATAAGHGGGDYFVMREFYRAVAEDREPPIDIFDAATWSSFLPLSAQSIKAGFKAVDVPDFTRGAWKNRTMTGFGLT